MTGWPTPVLRSILIWWLRATTRDMGVECAHQLLSLAERPTAIVAASDETAFGVYDAAAARRLCIPDDLSVVGFDNTLEGNSMNPPLTTVDQSIEAMGALAADIVLKLIQGQPWRADSIKCRHDWSFASLAGHLGSQS